MIKSAITHPPLLAALAQCGHKTQVLIADGNYACMTHAPKDATVVYLNLAPGTLAAPPILEKLLACINVESAALMACPPDFTNTIEAEYRQLLPAQCPVEHLPREAFYAAVKSDRTLLVIASGEQRRFANLLLTVAPGVKKGLVDRIKRGAPPLAVTDPQSVFPVLLQEPHRYSW